MFYEVGEMWFNAKQKPFTADLILTSFIDIAKLLKGKPEIKKLKEQAEKYQKALGKAYKKNSVVLNMELERLEKKFKKNRNHIIAFLIACICRDLRKFKDAQKWFETASESNLFIMQSFYEIGGMWFPLKSEHHRSYLYYKKFFDLALPYMENPKLK